MKTYDILKKLCTMTYLFGVGDLWYEDSNKDNLLYKVLSNFLFLICSTCVIMEILVSFIGGYPQVYINEARTLAVTHSIILLKAYIIRSKKMSVRELNRDLVNTCVLYEDDDIYNKQYKKILLNIKIYVIIAYITVFCYMANALQRAISLDEPFLPTSICWPAYNDVSTLASIIRAMCGFFIFTVSSMIVITDCLMMSHLVLLSFKFTTLRKYFENLRIQYDKDLITPVKFKASRLCRGFLEGIILHQQLLRLFRNIENAFGLPMSLQVCQSSGTAVLLLMQFALSKEMNIAGGAAVVFYITTLLIMLAIILWNAGDLTYETSLLSDAIFQCGWHLSPLETLAHKDVRQLVLLATAQAQQPLIMKAFGVSNMSYATFVSIVRATYSVFAVMYNGTS